VRIADFFDAWASLAKQGVLQVKFEIRNPDNEEWSLSFVNDLLASLGSLRMEGRSAWKPASNLRKSSMQGGDHYE